MVFLKRGSSGIAALWVWMYSKGPLACLQALSNQLSPWFLGSQDLLRYNGRPSVPLRWTRPVRHVGKSPTQGLFLDLPKPGPHCSCPRVSHASPALMQALGCSNLWRDGQRPSPPISQEPWNMTDPHGHTPVPLWSDCALVALDCRLLQVDDAISPDPDRKVSFRTTLVVQGCSVSVSPVFTTQCLINFVWLFSLPAPKFS